MGEWGPPYGCTRTITSEHHGADRLRGWGMEMPSPGVFTNSRPRSTAAKLQERRHMQGSFDFVSLCPKCGQAKLQHGYTYAELRTVLGAGDLIEAHCATCDEVWSISRRQRVEIARQIGAEETMSPLRPRAVRPHEILRAPPTPRA